MKAVLIKVEPKKLSRNGDCYFQRLKFKLEDGRFAMTDLVSSFRNFAWWKPIIEKGEGTWITNVFLKEVAEGKPLKINADSQVMSCIPPILPLESEDTNEKN